MKTLVGDAREIKSLGYPSVRENWCRPYGTRAFVPLHPALPCRAFTYRRYAAGVSVVLVPPLAFNGSSHAVSTRPENTYGTTSGSDDASCKSMMS